MSRAAETRANNPYPNPDPRSVGRAEGFSTAFRMAVTIVKNNRACTEGFQELKPQVMLSAEGGNAAGRVRQGMGGWLGRWLVGVHRGETHQGILARWPSLCPPPPPEKRCSTNTHTNPELCLLAPTP